MQEDTVYKLAGQKNPKDKYKDPYVLPQVNKTDMARTMKAIKVYLRSYCGVKKASLAYIIRRNIKVYIYGT